LRRTLVRQQYNGAFNSNTIIMKTAYFSNKKFLCIRICICALAIFFSTFIIAQKKQRITVVNNVQQHTVDILVGKNPFTSFIYPDSLEKPVLYPIYSAGNTIITRGYPLVSRPNEPTDHPHHIGLWLNYENVNGLDFWNNSSAIPKEKKASYGWIKTTAITATQSGTDALLSYNANWQDIKKNVLLQESTSFHFNAYNNLRIIDRITTLTAMQDVTMPDVKDGFLGLRVAHELELPSKDEREFTDAKGNITIVQPANDHAVSGNYITSRGISGDAAWSTRAEWCMLYGKMGNDTISVAIIDHPQNIGYPTYWHARGYGLFAANPLGQKIFSNGTETLNYALKKGQSVTFTFRVVIGANKQRLTNEEVNQLAAAFAKTYK
jgi:hypothetical protein